MVVGRIQITRRAYAGRFLPFLFFLGSFMTPAFVMHKTDYFVRERLGGVIIPAPDHLQKTGPYIVTSLNSRYKKGLVFKGVNGGGEYFEDWNSFQGAGSIIPIEQIANLNQGKATAYLWLSDKNPIRKVWRIQIQGQELMPYRLALRNYDTETIFVPRFLLKFAALSFICFIFSMLQFSRIAPPLLTKEKE